MSRNSRVRDRGYVSSHVSIAAATYDEFTLDYLVVAGGGSGGVTQLQSVVVVQV
jgi:hypothetical protein